MNLRLAAVLAVLLFGAGCQSSSIKWAGEKPMLAKIPASLKQACAGVVSIPDRDLTEADVARLWSKDRKALGECVRRHGALAEAASALEAQGQ